MENERKNMELILYGLYYLTNIYSLSRVEREIERDSTVDRDRATTAFDELQQY